MINMVNGVTDTENKKGLKEYKLCVLGEQDSGKSSYTLRLIQYTFVEGFDISVQDSYKKRVEFDGEFVIVNILDTVSEDDHSLLLKQRQICDRHGFIFLYSVTSRVSFDSIINHIQYVTRMRDPTLSNDSMPAILVGTKCDLDEEREVCYEEGKQLADSLGMKFWETSAKLNINIDNSLLDVLKVVREGNCDTESRPSTPVTINNPYLTSSNSSSDDSLALNLRKKLNTNDSDIVKGMNTNDNSKSILSNNEVKESSRSFDSLPYKAAKPNKSNATLRSTSSLKKSISNEKASTKCCIIC
ncbi:hypothetical protein Kpol_505p1 [Vanderwaltozyma polyspora DSM 70294]|uniref:Uncharacterized protein n=1 Tax=Vanderwaltozyma polyspora (strain ATCC 22028 / DSM 70294 / BCRC 21397 / CBS 2163 / NBRC 10782 / NRRL Y-8283 / UCD 57-17) TaxID=436907 RepID=A7TN93_VANPO|nr:uncharacterized protein Kpol_505p1 [Vanderwaltozyma polyspora DSM 70294]EDO16225.1 hypothetical protein Kpol_505p1 [Vanderwaltozyma polyspora DSM 70294]